MVCVGVIDILTYTLSREASDLIQSEQSRGPLHADPRFIHPVVLYLRSHYISIIQNTAFVFHVCVLSYFLCFPFVLPKYPFSNGCAEEELKMAS